MPPQAKPSPQEYGRSDQHLDDLAYQLDDRSPSASRQQDIANSKVQRCLKDSASKVSCIR